MYIWKVRSILIKQDSMEGASWSINYSLGGCDKSIPSPNHHHLRPSFRGVSCQPAFLYCFLPIWAITILLHQWATDTHYAFMTPPAGSSNHEQEGLCTNPSCVPIAPIPGSGSSTRIYSWLTYFPVGLILIYWPQLRPAIWPLGEVVTKWHCNCAYDHTSIFLYFTDLWRLQIQGLAIKLLVSSL